MRSQFNQILHSDAQPIAHILVKSLFLLAVGVVVAIAMVETLPNFDYTTNSFLRRIRETAWLILTVEFFLRIWVEPERMAPTGVLVSRIAYLRSPLGIVDLLAVLPAWISLFHSVDLHWFELAAAVSLFKLSRYVPALSLVWNVVVRQSRSIFAALVVLSILLVFAATVIYFFEYEAQPESFESIPQSLWWAITTMATVGYGDMAPITPIGRLIGGIAMIFGIAMFAVPAGILASGFAEELRKRDFVVNWQSVARVPLFARLDATAIASVAQLLKPRSVSANQAIVRRGDVADSMYFIMEGEVEVELAPTPVRLKQGEFFGEIALIQNIRRTATIFSITNCRLLVLEAVDFHRLVDQIPELKEQIERTSDERLSDNNRQSEE